jgi:hypothetical protein
MPVDYRRALQEMEEAQREPEDAGVAAEVA